MDPMLRLTSGQMFFVHDPPHSHFNRSDGAHPQHVTDALGHPRRHRVADEDYLIFCKMFKDHSMEIGQQPSGVGSQRLPKVWLARVEHAQLLRINLVAAGRLTAQIVKREESSFKPSSDQCSEFGAAAADPLTDC